MDNYEFKNLYWSKLKILVGDMISRSTLFEDKTKYVIDCFEILKKEVDKIDISEDDQRAIFAKLRKQIEDRILK